MISLTLILRRIFNDLMSLFIIILSTDDGSLEMKRYNVDFLLH